MVTSELFDKVVQLMEESGWPVLLVPRQTVALTRAHAKNGQWDCQMHLREEAQQLNFYSICPFSTPEDRRSAMAEFLTRANEGIPHGNFEMSYADGSVRYKTNLTLLGVDLNISHIHNLALPNTWVMDQYLPGIQAVAEGRMDPQAAIEMVEKPQAEADQAATPQEEES